MLVRFLNNHLQKDLSFLHCLKSIMLIALPGKPILTKYSVCGNLSYTFKYLKKSLYGYSLYAQYLYLGNFSTYSLFTQGHQMWKYLSSAFPHSPSAYQTLRPYPSGCQFVVYPPIQNNAMSFTKQSFEFIEWTTTWGQRILSLLSRMRFP